METNGAAHEDSLARRARLLDEWVARERAIAMLHAEQAELLAERLDLMAAEPDFESRGDVSLRSLAAEYAAAGHIPPSTAAARLTDAWTLVHQYPLTLAGLRGGRISRRHADVILAEAPDVPEGQDAAALRASYEERVVPFAERETAARTRAHARAVATALTPQSTLEAHRRGRARRSVTVTPVGDGMAVLTALLPEILAYAIEDRLTSHATQVVKARPARRAQPTPEPTIAPDDLDAAGAVAEELQPEPTAAAGFATDESAATDPAADDPAADDPATERSAAYDESTADEPVFLEDLSQFSAAARAHDLLEESADDPPPSTSTQPRPPLGDDDIPDLDAELEALLREYADATPVDPSPPGHERTQMSTRYLPNGPIGVNDDDTRTMDQIRADVLADILLTADPATSSDSGLESVRATVQVTIAATTLAGADDRPAQLDGVGPIDPEWARALAGVTPSLDRLFLDHRGMVTATDSYTPTANMKRFLRARDQHCRFPGCRAPVHRCQADHNHDHAKGGRTELENLALFCTGHHPIKHPHLPNEDRWSARQLGDGIVEWTSPLGRTYTDTPPARVMFV